MEKADHCISCGKRLINKGDASFFCPSCGNVLVGRCNRCRKQGALYTCPSCGFQGP